MSEIQVQIDDPEQPPSKSPYSNLFVPLVVVPAGLVVVIVIVFTLFGAVAGQETSLEQNLDRIVSGGTNEREQALWNLVQQLTANHQAGLDGETPPFALPDNFSAMVHEAAREIGEDEPSIRLTLGIVEALMGEREKAAEVFLPLLDLTLDADPRGEVRLQAIANLGLLGDARAREPVMAFLADEDVGLRQIAAAALQNLRGAGVTEALEGALSDHDFVVQLNAAISLSHVAPDSQQAASLLRKALDPTVYAALHAADARKYQSQELISSSRVKALQSLVRMNRPEDREFIDALTDDADPSVQEAALLADVPEHDSEEER